MKRRGAAGIVAAGLALAVVALAPGQQVHRNGFEANDTAWVKGTADAPFRETVHRLTDEFSHTGQRSEHIQLNAENGNTIYYHYDIGRAPITEELSASVWLKANRPGIQLLARLVLPRERNPNRPDEPMTTLLTGDNYRSTSRWQQLELRGPVKLVTKQQQLLRVELNRDVNVTDAYIDRLILNVYAGPGQTDVWIDDLEVAPVADGAPFKAASRPAGKDALPDPKVPARTAVVKLEGEQLQVSGKRFFMRAIRHTDTPLKALRDFGR